MKHTGLEIQTANGAYLGLMHCLWEQVAGWRAVLLRYWRPSPSLQQTPYLNSVSTFAFSSPLMRFGINKLLAFQLNYIYLVSFCTQMSLHSHTCPRAWWCQLLCPPCRPCCCSTGSSCPTHGCSKKHNILFSPSALLHSLSAFLDLCSHTHRQVCMCT